MRPRHARPPAPFAVGETVRLLEDHGPHRAGTEIRVERLDRSDDTAAGILPDGEPTGWFPVAKAVPRDIVGWDFLKDALTPRGRELLEAFDGHRTLRLSPGIADAVIQTLPDLEGAIRGALSPENRPKAPSPRRRPGLSGARADAGELLMAIGFGKSRGGA